MNLEEASRRRKTAGKIAAVFFVLLFASILDGCIAKFREPINVFNILPGDLVKVDGPLEKEVKNTGELAYTSTSDSVRLSFDATQKGYWLGGRMWIGTITTSPQISPGEYEIKAYIKALTVQKPSAIFRVKVHKDYASLRTSFKSLIRRYLDISPWWVALALFPFMGGSVGIVYYFAQKEEYFLAQQGKAEVYLVRQREQGCEVVFGLGTRSGVQPGMRLGLYDEKGKFMGTIQVQEATESDAFALVGYECAVKEGYIVSIERR